MTVRVYFDVFPWTKVDNLYFSTSVSSMGPGKDGKRYAVDITFPDPAGADEVLPPVTAIPASAIPPSAK